MQNCYLFNLTVASSSSSNVSDWSQSRAFLTLIVQIHMRIFFWHINVSDLSQSRAFLTISVQEISNPKSLEQILTD